MGFVTESNLIKLSFRNCNSLTVDHWLGSSKRKGKRENFEAGIVIGWKKFAALSPRLFFFKVGIAVGRGKLRHFEAGIAIGWGTFAALSPRLIFEPVENEQGKETY